MNYELSVTNVPKDVPADVLVEHVAYALRHLQKDRKALKRINVSVSNVSKPRSHPFDGPTVNDDIPSSAYKNPGTYSTGANSYMTYGRETPIFSGKAEDTWVDTPLTGTLDEATVVLDVTDIMPAIYSAIAEDFPYLSEFFRAKRREDRTVKRESTITDPPVEGEWDLDDGDHVGED